MLVPAVLLDNSSSHQSKPPATEIVVIHAAFITRADRSVPAAKLVPFHALASVLQGGIQGGVTSHEIGWEPALLPFQPLLLT